ncbi:MAG TPA: DinB family protein [Chitinophagaceae bacterium]
MPRPDLSRVPEFYHGYINNVKQDDLAAAVKEHTAIFEDFFNKIPAGKREFRYAEGKWSIKEILQHVIDAERVFVYRAMCFSRKDQTPLPSFDENAYADNSKAGKRNWEEMREEFRTLRRSTELLFGSFDEEQLETSGIASGKPIYVRALCYIAIGHAAHHLNVIKERYL